MNLNETHIVLAKTAAGKTEVLYAGDDVTRANAAFEKAQDTFAVVGISSFPPFTRTRFPIDEVDASENRAREDKAQAKAAADRNKTLAAHKRKAAEKLLEEADTLHPQEKAAAAAASAPVKVVPETGTAPATLAPQSPKQPK